VQDSIVEGVLGLAYTDAYYTVVQKEQQALIMQEKTMCSAIPTISNF